ncbi:hypothetical protein KDA_52870 [Dictyobacter alpinus]|uniref:HTH cro/C1-type domain-containing protein n=1 Tax=Dictyobacter alpinus TaxID=2014873 RepID=A0A402BEJ3_9CHLR|nr:helix-turn-helix domain-containing protein [Dictyobacter alpinus]GCE29803.1 hypothetical protein KDA_52870 [Dictyobacter alpinus]
MTKNELLRQERLKRNWRLIDVADGINATVTTVQRWERGIQQPRLYYRAQLCTLFGLSAEELGFNEDKDSAASHVLLSAGPVSSAPIVSSEGETGKVYWHVPYMRNPHFVGRDELLHKIEQGFTAPTSIKTPRSPVQIQMLTGLSGMGKTQIAVEYAYRVQEQEPETHVFWITAASEETILNSWMTIANQLPSSCVQWTKNSPERIENILHWLEECEAPWLLIVDNVNNLKQIQTYLPHRGLGRLLFTTQASAVSSLGTTIEVGSLDIDVSTNFLLQRAGRLDQVTPDDAATARQIVEKLALFPLALDQAGAYIEETGCSIATYLQLYQTYHQTLLARRGNSPNDHPDPVATTWACSFQVIEQRNPAAAQLLRLLAYLSPYYIPEEIITEGAAYWPPVLRQAVTHPLLYDQMFQDLLAFSLVKRLPAERILNIHQLVQIVQRDQMDAEERHKWTTQIVQVLHMMFPHDPAELTTRPKCLHVLGQTNEYQAIIEQQELASLEATELLEWSGSHLIEYELYHIAEPLLQRALLLREQQQGLLHPTTVQCLNDLAFLYVQQERYEEAHKLYTWLWNQWCETSSIAHPEEIDIHTCIHALLASVPLTQEREKRLRHLLAHPCLRKLQMPKSIPSKHVQISMIRELYAQGTSIRNIAQQVGIARNTVRKYVRIEA